MKALSAACAFLMVAATAAAQNLLTNGSFDGSLSGWYHESNVTYDATLDATGTSGSGSAKTSAVAGAVSGSVGQCVAVTASTKYKVGGKVYIASGQTTSAVVKSDLWFASDANCQDQSPPVTLSSHAPSGGSWVTFEDDFTSPASAQSVYFAPEVDNQATAAGSPTLQVNFDDLHMNAFSGTSYSRWIPAVIHKDVPSKNAKWRSDVAILNRSDSTANLTIEMHLVSGPVSQTTQLAGNSQLLQTDVAGWLGVSADSGPLEVTSDQEFFLSGRTYNQVDTTHTYGQDYDGQESSELLAADDSSTSTAWLPQLTENAFYRTNIGITNTGATTANVTLTLYSTVGDQMWTDSRDYAAGEFYQYQQPYLRFGSIDVAYAKVTVNSGSGVVAYASVTDNNTGDPTTITMKR